MGLKEELTGKNGFIKELMDNIMPDTKGMAKLALNKYHKKHPKLSKKLVSKQFSNILTKLIAIEYAAYQQFIKGIIEKSIEHFLGNKKNKSKYPTIHRCIQAATGVLSSGVGDNVKIARINEILYPYNHIIAFSSMQSAKTRMGKSLENHVETLLNILGFPFQTQKTLKSGEVLDFVFPSLEVAKKDPPRSLIAECQSTLKDRFRLSLGKTPREWSGMKYILTASGKGLITPKDLDDITGNKVSEIRDKGWKLVVFDDVKKGKFPKNTAVVSYSEFVNKHIPSAASLW